MNKTLLSGTVKLALFFGLMTFFCLQTDGQDYTNLKITEISYHPLDYIVGTDTIQGKDLEFIEFKNIGETSIDLTGLVLDSAVYYEFPNDILLGPKQFWVVAAKPGKFLTYYGIEPHGNFSGNLANSGDEILLKDASGNEVIHFTYDDHSPWPEEADGEGYTLVSSYINPTGDPADDAYWRASLYLYGSPNSDDVPTAINTLTENIGSLAIYPNPISEYFTISFTGENTNQNLSVSLYSLNGSLVLQRVVENNETVNLSDYSIQSGFYIIKVSTEQWIETQKVVISR